MANQKQPAVHRNCRRKQGGRINAMKREFKASCGKSYAMAWARERHDRQHHSHKVQQD